MKSRLKSFIYLVRPIGWAPFLFPLLYGLIDSGFSSLYLVYSSILIIILILSGIYVLNFYSDIKADKLSKVKKDIKMSEQPFVTGEVKSFEGIIFALFLIGSGLGFSWLINLNLFLIATILTAIGAFYSFPPRLKGVPFFDALANATSASLCYVAGWVIFRNIYEISILPVIWIFLLVASTYLLTVIIDMKGDKKAGVRTTAVFLGIEKTIKVSFLTYILSLFFYALVLIHSLKLAYILLLPFFAKSVFTYCKLFKNPSLTYNVAKGAAVKVTIAVILLITIYSLSKVFGTAL